MIVLDPGHEYLLDSLDGEQANHLIFVKREGEKYPGNVGSHPGTTMQEVLRALIERARYVNAQTPCEQTAFAIDLMVDVLMLFEERAADRHGRPRPKNWAAIVSGDGKCKKCGHVGCDGGCH